MSYLIGSGFIGGLRNDAFAPIWLRNILRYCDPLPSRVAVLSAKASGAPITSNIISEIRLTGDLGHFMDLIEGRKLHKFNGWMGAVLALALIAYNDESDFVFLEQDCLAFGPWVKQLYEDIGTAGVLFGRKHQTAPWMPCSQSLFMVRHSYIPEFVRLILSTDAQNKEGELGEHKFERMAQQFPNDWKMMSWGYDRERPFNVEDKVFYVQQLSEGEIQFLADKSLISL